MSIRSEPKTMSAGMHNALMIPPEVMRTAAAATADAPVSAPTGQELALAGANTGALADQQYAAANDFNTTNAAHPLKRTVVVNIRASLNDLCLKKSRATWAPPSAEATRAIFQQRKFTDLQGTSEAQGDLKSVVLHKMAVSSQRNTFPIALGVRIAGVDDATYSQTGEAYSTVALPATDMHTSRTLQEEDTSLAYECKNRPSNTHTPHTNIVHF